MPVSSHNREVQVTDALIEARKISVIRGGVPILKDVDVRVLPSEIITLVGLNGSGKSTLVKVLSGLVKPDGGDVITRPGLRIGYCPQHARADNTLPLSVYDFMHLVPTSSASSISSALEEVGVGGLESRQISQLSGGEYQRVLLARAILRRPEVLILDEPMAGVDIAGQSDLYGLIPRLRDRYECGVILVSHDIHIVMAATDRVVCLNHHVCCSGQPESVAVHPEFVSLFGSQVARSLAIYTHQHDHAHDLHGDTLGAGHEEGDHSACDHDHA